MTPLELQACNSGYDKMETRNRLIVPHCAKQIFNFVFFSFPLIFQTKQQK